MLPLKARISIVWLATAATLAPLMATAALLLWLSARSATRTGEAVGLQVMKASTQRVEESLLRNFDRARGLNESFSDLIRDGTISATNLDQWRSPLFAQLRANPEISAITFANADNRCTFIARYADRVDYGTSGTGADALKLRTCVATIDGKIDEGSAKIVDFDCRSRPWYRSAVASQGPAWTPAYTWITGEQWKAVHESSVAFTRALRVGGNDAPTTAPLIGVIAIDLSLSGTSAFLQRVAEPLQATMFITDESGRLLGTSVKSAVDPTSNIAQEIDPVERAASAKLTSLGTDVNPDVHTFDVGGHPYWLKQVAIKVSPKENWRLTLALPQESILGPARAAVWSITEASIACVVVACALSALLARYMSRPFRQLAAFAHELGEGRFHRRLNVGENREVTELASALNTMAANLEERVALLAQKDAAVSANALKARLIAHVSHEFRTPLNAIIGYGELLRDQSDADGRRRDVADASNILVASRHLLSLVENLLDLSAIDSGRLRLEMVNFSIADLIQEVAITIRPAMRVNRNRLHLTTPPAGARMTSDPVRVRQVLINLLANSGKFTECGDVSLLADVDEEAGRLQFIVGDTGPGISPDRLSRLFEPLQDVGSASQGAPRQGGAGLGLAITRQLCLALGGDIRVETGPGGTQMVVDLPLKGIHLEEQQDGISAALKS